MSYIEHQAVEVHGFFITDATSTDPRRHHDDLVWVGFGGMEGRWLTPDQADDVARAIMSVTLDHRARHAVQAGLAQEMADGGVLEGTNRITSGAIDQA